MLNLQMLNAISFNKGCYTGQEIVARMHYLGKLKKRMYRATLGGIDIAPAAGSELYAANAISGELQSVGHVVDAVIHNGQCELLAVIPDELVESAKPLQLGKNGREITVVPLPYAITTAHSSKQ
jgi:folate-binding Fe-S cluster repair protein YgfZ